MPKTNLIGNTPMIKIVYEYEGKKNDVYAKLEYYNLTGSLKDRVANQMIQSAREKEILKPGMPIVEATSGNTGISLAALGAYYKHPVFIYMPDWASKERIQLMKSYGANVILVSKEEGGFVQCVEKAKKFAEENHCFLANQFANQDNLKAHYEGTGLEILNQVSEPILAFVSGVGTGGTLMGICKRLKEKFQEMQVVAIEPETMPIISTGKIIAQHKIEGIGDDFVPALLEKEAIDHIFFISDEDAINMSRKIARDLGIGVGISSGANMLGCVYAREKLDKQGAIVTVFADDNKKYLSTDLMKEIKEDMTFLSNQIKLLSYEVIEGD